MRRIGLFFQMLFGIIVILTAGCALPDKPTQPGYYDLGPAPLVMASAVAADAPAAGASGTSGTSGVNLPALVLPEFEASSALERPAILYRLLYADAHALRAYSQAQWQAVPAQLVRQRLKSRLAVGRVVLTGSEPASSNAPVLQIELDTFSQQFDSPGSSQGLVQLRATLSWVAASGEKRVAQKSFAAQRPAPSADAAGGVRALAADTDAVMAEIDLWVQSVR